MASFFTRASAAIDRSVVRLMERRLAPRTTATPARTDDRWPSDPRARLVEIARTYNAGTLGHPSPFFPRPKAPPITLGARLEGPLGTTALDASFPSNYQPFVPAARELYERITENHTAHVRLWTTINEPPRPTIVLLHGWGGGNHWLTARTFVANYWLRHGFDVASFVLPLHGVRAPAGGSGALFPSPNPLRTNETFGQAVHDLRALAGWLRQRGVPAVGALGMSLGGYTAALWASVVDDGELDFAIAMIPAVSMARLMWRHGEDHPMRVRAIKAGIDEDLFAEVFAVHAPTTRAPRLARDRLAVVAGRGDRITPPDQARTLARHWGVEPVWFEGGHLAQLGRGDALRTVRRQLAALALPGRAPRMG